MDIDSNNNGTIDEADDPIEGNSPKFIQLNSDDDLVPVTLAVRPSGMSQTVYDALRVEFDTFGSTGVNIWDSPTKSHLLPTDTIMNLSEVPSTLYLEGISAGNYFMVPRVLTQAGVYLGIDLVVMTVVDNV